MSEFEQQNDKSPDTRHLYAWLSRDEDGIEGLVAVPLGGDGAFPLVFADERRARRFTPHAKEAARRRGFPAALVVFERVGEPIAEVQ